MRLLRTYNHKSGCWLMNIFDFMLVNPASLEQMNSSGAFVNDGGNVLWAKRHGHYCKVCGEYKSNESFSGKGQCGAYLQEVRRASCRTTVRGYDAHKAMEPAVAVIAAAAGLASKS